MSFIEELWKSIFEPGASPVLVKATHFSFAALILTLVGLLISTGSLHFVALLVIATGLWAGITWFIGEVAAFQAEQARQAKQAKETKEVDQDLTKENSSKEMPDVVATASELNPSQTNVGRRS